MTNNETAVTVIEQTPTAVVEWNLDNWPTDQFNRLVPTQTIGIANEFIRPVVAVVQLDLETDTYTSRDLKEGHRAPNAKGLAKLADAAGVSFIDEVRLDDGSDPMRAHVRVVARMVDPTGMPRSATGARDYVLASQAMTDAQRQRAKGFVYEHASTRARHRALRLLLSLAQSYPVKDLAKPFAVVRFLPNTQHPEVREIYKGALAASVTAMFGPQQAPAQLGAGVMLTDEHLDDAVEQPRPLAPSHAPRALAPGRASEVDTDSGAGDPGPQRGSEAGGDDEPDWITGSAQAAAAEPDLRAIVAARMRDEGQPKGAATAPQKELLARVFADVGEDAARVAGRGIRALFGPDAVRTMTAAQARAIGMADDELGHKAFLAQWAELAG